ncbi:aldo/keto reductase, partial [candidate division KSB1 bacterium]
SLEESLKALRTDYIDIMLVHDVRREELINGEVVMEFLAKAKEQGKIRAHGFSVHTRQVEIIKSANELNFYDVILVAYNHKGTYSRSSGTIKWDMDMMDNELSKAVKNGTGIVAMKTCLCGPCSPREGSPPTYMDAVKWVINHEFIHTTTTAMANIEQIDENLGALG